MKLKPCPFCGGHAVIKTCVDEQDDSRLYIKCERCGFQSGKFVNNAYDTNMADLWNERVDKDWWWCGKWKNKD